MYADRRDAGRALAAEMVRRGLWPDPIVLALPRGGVPVAFEVAAALRCPLDILVVRKLGVPEQPEWAFGAIASGGSRVLNDDVIQSAALSPATIERVTVQERAELERRERLYREPSAAIDPRGRTVILVDDGLATGATMRAAVEAIRQRDPRATIVAVPVGSSRAVADLAPEVTAVICLEQPWDFHAVGVYYGDFAPMSDREVRDLLAAARRARGAPVERPVQDG